MDVGTCGRFLVNCVTNFQNPVYSSQSRMESGWIFRKTFVDVVEFKTVLEKYSSIFIGQEYSTLPNSVFQHLSEAIKLWRSPTFHGRF